MEKEMFSNIQVIQLTYSDHWPSLLDDHEPVPVAMLDVAAESALNDDNEFSER